MSTFSLKIISTDKVFYDGKCEYLVIPTIDGEKGILAHHENMVIAVEIGELRFRKPDGEWVTAVVSKGFAEIVNNRASVLVNTAERPEDIDVKRAEEAGTCRRTASSEAEHSGVLSVTGFYGPCHDTTESVQKQTRGYLESQKNELFS